MCRYMGLNAFGTDNFLRGAIRSRLLHIRRDDQLIESEGVDEPLHSRASGSLPIARHSYFGRFSCKTAGGTYDMDQFASA